MLDVKKIAADPEGTKEALRKRYWSESDKQKSDDCIDIICLMHHEIKLTRQAIEEAKHLQKLLEQDLHKWRRTHPEMFK